MSTHYEFEVEVNDEFFASTNSANRDVALNEALNYAEQYRSEGDVKVYEIKRTLVATSAAPE